MKHTLFYILVFLVFACHPPGERVNVQSNDVLTTSQLQEDFKVFRTSLEEMHPGLYSFISKDSLDYYFKESYATLSSNMTKDEFAKILTRIIRRLYDEHTAVNFSYKYAGLKKFMPVKIYWNNGRPFVHKNILNDAALVPGSEVVSINGKDPVAIYKELQRSYPNYTTDETLQYDVYSLHFDYLYASFYEQPDSFHIVAIHPGTKKQYHARLPAIDVSDTLHMLPIQQWAKEYVRTDTCYAFKINTEQDYALMKISSFNQTGSIVFSEVLKRDFDLMHQHKIKNLVIDLRYNRGGDPVYGAELMTYLYNKPFHIFDTMYAVLHKKPSYYQCIDSTGLSFENWKMTVDSLKGIQNGKANYYSCFRDRTFNPSALLFTGKVYVLVNSDVHSAALVTATLLEYYTPATFIGTPISGPYNGGNAIDFPTLTLPHSKLEVVIPLIHYSCSVPDNLYPFKKGIKTDIIINTGITDRIQHHDPVMDSVLNIIRKSPGIVN